ncbi:MAG: carboxymuconolactone decarboxylase family protein [Acidobacteriaceae bacterium]
MSQRIHYAAASPEALKPLYEAGRYLHTSTTIEPSLLNLIYLRASQMNRCAFCIAMHWREAKEAGLSDDQLHGLLAWREAPWYSDRERAALAWTEAITDIAGTHAPDYVYLEAKAAFTERELVDLTLAITTINAWNRFAIGFRTPPEKAAAVVAAQKTAAQQK